MDRQTAELGIKAGDLERQAAKLREEEVRDEWVNRRWTKDVDKGCREWYTWSKKLWNWARELKGWRRKLEGQAQAIKLERQAGEPRMQENLRGALDGDGLRVQKRELERQAEELGRKAGELEEQAEEQWRRFLELWAQAQKIKRKIAIMFLW